MDSEGLKYDKLIIYYFSGTGNAKNASSWIIGKAESLGMQTNLVNIDRFKSIESPELTDKTLIGFCYPTHGFNAPPLILKFIRKYPRVQKVDAFILNTRGGLKLSKIFIPGLSGIAQLLPALILRAKGFRIIGMQPMDLPSNWMLLHPGLRKKVIDSIYTRCKRITTDFATEMIHGKRNYKALLSLPIDIMLAPISLGYYLLGRFFLAKTLIATNACNLCGKCIRECPVTAIKDIKGHPPFWTYRCESCMRCVNHCPERAIETMHGFGVAILIISSMIISPAMILLLKYLGAWKFIESTFITENIWSWIYAAIILIFMFISYRVVFFLMRFKFFNKIITTTSLSTYMFWRRYKPPTV